MATSLTFCFQESNQNFQTYREMSLERVKVESNQLLMGKCLAQAQEAGVLRPIHLSTAGQYTLSITGWANNDRTYLVATDSQYQPLTSEVIHLGKKISQQQVTFQVPSSSKRIRIGLLIGGDSVALPIDCFFVKEVTLSADFSWSEITVSSNSSVPNYLNSLNSLRNSSSLPHDPSFLHRNHSFSQNPPSNQSPIENRLITRVFQTVPELEKELQQPRRADGSQMQIGEYAILRNQVPEGPPTEYLYRLSPDQSLRYLAKVGTGLPTFLGEALHLPPGRILPIYSEASQAQTDLDRFGSKFYHPRGELIWRNQDCQELQEQIYLYLDSDGYVRWLKSSSSKK